MIPFNTIIQILVLPDCDIYIFFTHNSFNTCCIDSTKAEEYKNIDDVKNDLNKFLIYYNFNRRHGSLRKELKVRTPFDAVQSWFLTKPEIFKILPNMFQDIAFEMVQRGET